MAEIKDEEAFAAWLRAREARRAAQRLRKSTVSDDIAVEKCICKFSERLCPQHGEDMSPAKRALLGKDALEASTYLQRAAQDGFMDEATNERLARFLRSDVELPYELRTYLARALEGKSRHWSLVWKAMKPGPARTFGRVRQQQRRRSLTIIAAGKAEDAIQSGEPVEAAIARMQQELKITRAAAYAALRRLRDLRRRMKTRFVP